MVKHGLKPTDGTGCYFCRKWLVPGTVGEEPCNGGRAGRRTGAYSLTPKDRMLTRRDAKVRGKGEKEKSGSRGKG